MESDRFKPGDLAWVNNRFEPFRKIGGDLMGFAKIEPGTPVTIIRRAMCKDYPRFMQREHASPSNVTMARWSSTRSWLTLVDGQLVLIYDVCLNERRYKSRKKRGR